MKSKLAIWLVVGGVLFAVQTLHAQGTAAFQSLKIPVGARAAALGGAFVALADDPSGLFWNAASPARLGSFQVQFSYNLWLLDTSQRFFAFSVPMNSGAIAFGVTHFSAGEIPRIEHFLKVGSYSAQDICVALGFARNLGRRLSLGVSGKILRGEIDRYVSSAWALDIGALADLQPLRLGFSVRNVGSRASFVKDRVPLPLSAEMGAAFVGRIFSASVSGGTTNDRDSFFAAGMEIRPVPQFSLLAGYNTRYPFSLGAEITVGGFAISYAYGTIKDFKAVQRFSILWRKR